MPEMFSLRVLLTAVLPLLITLAIVAERTDDFIQAEETKYGADWRSLYQAGDLILTSDALKIYYATTEEKEAWRNRTGETIGNLLYTPLMVLFMKPFALFSHETGYVLWRVLTTASMAVVAGVLALSLRSWAWRACVFACVFGWDPLLTNLTIGQTGAFTAALLALVCLLICYDRMKGMIAGAAVSLKISQLVGPGLLAWEEGNKGLLVFAASVAAAVVLPFALFGPDAVEAFRGWAGNVTSLQEADLLGNHPYNQSITRIIPGEQRFEQAVLALCVGLAIFLVSKARNALGWEAAVALALMAGLLITPHSGIYDWGTVFVCLAFLRRSRVLWPVDQAWADLAIGGCAVLVFILGQYAFGHLGERLQVLTLFGLAFCALIAVASLLPVGKAPADAAPGLSSA